MQPGYLAAKHELLLVSDSGVMMKEDTLSDMVAHMTPDVGIVHQMPFCCDRKGWLAILEKVSVCVCVCVCVWGRGRCGGEITVMHPAYSVPSPLLSIHTKCYGIFAGVLWDRSC